MENPIKLREAEKQRIRAVYPLMVEKIRKTGNIAKREDVVKSFSEEAVQLAVAEKKMIDTRIIKRSASNAHPEMPIRVLQLPEYTGARPAWLDE